MGKGRSFLLALAALLLLSGCGGQRDGRETVTVALWSDQLTAGYGQYLRQAFPEVDFVFYTATNSSDFYRFKERQGDLPDILTLRRFSLNDVADWKDSLADLSDSGLTAAFPQSYLRSYTYSDGTVNWLPVCGEIDSILVNKTLLEENGIGVPRSCEEFAEACSALRQMPMWNGTAAAGNPALPLQFRGGLYLHGDSAGALCVLPVLPGGARVAPAL